MFENPGELIIKISDGIWGAPILVLLLGGGFYFLVYSRLAPLRYIGHAIQILTGKYDDPNEEGQLRHYQALATALAGTVGMGNVSGVAVAITMGGPGAIFWMWVSALLGVSTKFFTCTLAVMFRGKDDAGEIQGGPMYFITEGLGKKWKPVAIFFALMAMIGVSPLFQANQLTQMVRDVILIPNNIQTSLTSDLVTGIVISIFVGLVVIGGIKRKAGSNHGGSIYADGSVHYIFQFSRNSTGFPNHIARCLYRRCSFGRSLRRHYHNRGSSCSLFKRSRSGNSAYGTWRSKNQRTHS